MSVPPILAVVPMKPLHLTKTRLAGRLTPSKRASLSLDMLKNVVAAAVCSKVSKVWVIGGDEVVKETALELGAEWRTDNANNLNAAMNGVIEQAFKIELAAMYLPADLAFVSSDDVDALVESSGQGRVVTLSPAHSDGGTNAVLIPLASPFRVTLGNDSFRRHLNLAKSLGIDVAVCDRPGLGFDLDTARDMDLYEEALLQGNSEIGRVAD